MGQLCGCNAHFGECHILALRFQSCVQISRFQTTVASERLKVTEMGVTVRVIQM